ncbi:MULTISPECIES: endospore germination permease [Paraliobacillus]|uniref:GerAB/ArcD/ProY family transporter n=1 Tax=Paraliobacillus TaxID=200903 RepID=UPI000DD4D64B|nr:MULTISPECIES: endospore germination permease [Paraliobacillus]
MHDQKTLKASEMFTMIGLFIGMKVTDTTPTLFAQKAQNAFWLIPIISFLVILPSFFLLIYLLKKAQNKNLMELIESLIGSKLGKTLGFLIFLSSFLLMCLDSRSYVEQIKLLYFPASPTTVLFFLFLCVVFFGAKKGLEVIGFTVKTSFLFIKLSALLLALLISVEIVWQRIFPIFGSGLSTILKEGALKGSIFSEFFLLTIAYTSFKDTKQFRIGTLFGVIFVIIEITFFFFVYATVFDYNSIEKASFPFHDITQYVQLGEYFANIETFFMVFWLLAGFLRFIIYIYLITWIFGAVFNISEFEPLILPFSFITLIIGMVPDNSVINELLFRDMLLNYVTPLFVLFPVILWIVALSRGALKK